MFGRTPRRRYCTRCGRQLVTANRSADQADHIDPWPDRDYSNRDYALIRIAEIRHTRLGDHRPGPDLYQPETPPGGHPVPQWATEP
jgi:hypothetical protein